MTAYIVVATVVNIESLGRTIHVISCVSMVIVQSTCQNWEELAVGPNKGLFIDVKFNRDVYIQVSKASYHSKFTFLFHLISFSNF